MNDKFHELPNGRTMNKMITTSLAGATLTCGLLLATLSQAALTTETFSSDGTWGVYSQDPFGGTAVTNFGFAEKVCLNASSPAGCPPDAVEFDFSGSGWGADLGSIPGAAWIWAPGTTGATYPADLQLFAFSKQLNIRGNQILGTIQVSADDYAEVIVNGTVAGSVGSTSDVFVAGGAQAALTSIDISAYLVTGINTITVVGQNGPSWFAGYSGPTSYSQNPAGVVFGGIITYNPLLTVTIEIKPGSSGSPINLHSRGTVPVAVLSTPTFDATQVDPASVTLAGAPVATGPKRRPMVFFTDVNGDGLLDAVFMFQTQALQLSSGDVQATLEGKTFDGTQIMGTGPIQIVGGAAPSVSY